MCINIIAVQWSRDYSGAITGDQMPGRSAGQTLEWGARQVSDTTRWCPHYGAHTRFALFSHSSLGAEGRRPCNAPRCCGAAGARQRVKVPSAPRAKASSAATSRGRDMSHCTPSTCGWALGVNAAHARARCCPTLRLDAGDAAPSLSPECLRVFGYTCRLFWENHMHVALVRMPVANQGVKH